jgi:NTP pyrophosphatase (non-canonical NTP hydrolase)
VTFEEYIVNVKRSESPSFQNIDPRILHGVIGCCTEAGELLDSVKKSLFYNRQLDLVNVEEELGDLLWYVALIVDACGFNFETILDKNIRKLKVRYPEQFTDNNAENRDLQSERRELETL